MAGADSRTSGAQRRNSSPRLFVAWWLIAATPVLVLACAEPFIVLPIYLWVGIDFFAVFLSGGLIRKYTRGKLRLCSAAILVISIVLAIVLFVRRGGQTMAAQRRLADTAQRLLPGLTKQAEVLAKSLPSSPPLAPPTIGYPYLQYDCYDGQGAPSFFGGARYHEMARWDSVMLEQRPDGTFKRDYFESFERAMGDAYDVDVSKVRSIVIVRWSEFETEHYSSAGGRKSCQTILQCEVFVFDKSTRELTAFRAFQPKSGLPEHYTSSDDFGISGPAADIQGEERAAVRAWLDSLPQPAP